MTRRAVWSVDDAAAWLDPPISAAKLRKLLDIAGVADAGRRSTGHSGPGVKVYDVVEVMRLHAAVAPWLARQAARRTAV